MLLAGTSTTYIEEADVDVEVNVHVIDSSIFSTEIQVRLIKGERREQRLRWRENSAWGQGRMESSSVSRLSYRLKPLT